MPSSPFRPPCRILSLSLTHTSLCISLFTAPCTAWANQQCEAGYYCPAGSTEPTICPKFGFCPTAGLGNYTLCTAGSFCNVTGLTAVAGSCAVGHYCPTASTAATQVTCEAGTFCPAGSANATICTAGFVFCFALDWMQCARLLFFLDILVVSHGALGALFLDYASIVPSCDPAARTARMQPWARPTARARPARIARREATNRSCVPRLAIAQRRAWPTIPCAMRRAFAIRLA
jgi:hypothetical protein